MKKLFLVFALAVYAFAQEPASSTKAANEQATGAKPTAEHKGDTGTAHAKEAVEHGEAGQEHEMPNEIWWKWANFIILVGALGWLIGKNAGPFFRTRSEAILMGIEEGRRAKAEADARAAEIERKLASLGTDIESLRTTARQEIEAEGARVRAETEQHLAKVQQHAEQEIESAAKTASQNLTAHAAELALQLAEEQLKNRVTPDVQKGFVSAFVRDLDGKGSKN